MARAYCYESRAGHKKENLKTQPAGTVQRGNRLYDISVDTEGNAWYTVRVITDRGILSEYEAIFGHPERRRGFKNLPIKEKAPF